MNMTFSKLKMNWSIMIVLMMSSILGVSMTEWFFVWMCLEVNVMAMCFMLSSNSQSAKFSDMTSFLYYLVQVFLSLTILSICLTGEDPSLEKEITLALAILGKAGVWPIHGWYMKIISSMEVKNKSFLIIMTWQKILPIFMVSMIQKKETLMILAMLLTLGTIVSSLSSLNKNFEMKKILAISSLNNNSWLLIASTMSLSCVTTFLMLYSLTLSVTLKTMEKIFNKTMSSMSMFWVTILVIMNLAGLPPLTMFWAKLLVLKSILLSQLMSEMALILMLSACFLLYHYMWMALNEISNSPIKSQVQSKSEKMLNKINLISMTSVLGATAIFILG